jgi:hypothetical protein
MRMTNYLLSIKSKYGNGGVVAHGIMVGLLVCASALCVFALYIFTTSK